MILIDTSVWIDHFRSSLPGLVDVLHEGDAMCHPFVIGELALGHLRYREETIDLLMAMPALPIAAHDDVLAFVERHSLAASGLGWVDAHLLFAALDAGVQVWSHDRPLRKQAAALAILFK